MMGSVANDCMNWGFELWRHYSRDDISWCLFVGTNVYEGWCSSSAFRFGPGVSTVITLDCERGIKSIQEGRDNLQTEKDIICKGGGDLSKSYFLVAELGMSGGESLTTCTEMIFSFTERVRPC